MNDNSGIRRSVLALAVAALICPNLVNGQNKSTTAKSTAPSPQHNSASQPVNKAQPNITPLQKGQQQSRVPGSQAISHPKPAGPDHPKPNGPDHPKPNGPDHPKPNGPDHPNPPGPRHPNPGPTGPGRPSVVEYPIPGGGRAVSVGGHRFVERPIRPGYVARTYVVGGHTYARVYRDYGWHGIHYVRYVPARYYSPVFYRWAVSPWPRPIVYTAWGWNATPWFRFYGLYFTPAPVYPAPSLWLTDYLIAQNLELAYQLRQQQAQQAAPQQPYYAPPSAVPSNQPVVLSPEVKQMIAEEVKQQLAAEQTAPTQPAPAATNMPVEAPIPALSPTQRVFVVSSALNVKAGNQACALTPGDIILRTADSPDPNNMVAVNVLSSKPGDCAINAASSIEVTTLQDMHNQFQEQIDTGAEQLAKTQGQNGVPGGPAPAPTPNPAGQAQPDPNAQQYVASLQADATSGKN